ncbi:hypothetical protein ACFFQF_21340 [Haladaptatus pallidirubidus]|uniref:hypothetical protein n=1 Tax=Haladaptatus pallidirubidus TaxID=1008152 RepID=UPI0035E8FB7A
MAECPLVATPAITGGENGVGAHDRVAGNEDVLVTVRHVVRRVAGRRVGFDAPVTLAGFEWTVDVDVPVFEEIRIAVLARSSAVSIPSVTK